MEARTRTAPGSLDVVTLSTGSLVRKIPAHLVRTQSPWLDSTFANGPAGHTGRAMGRGPSRLNTGTAITKACVDTASKA
jgi:hypothetical protein